MEWRSHQMITYSGQPYSVLLECETWEFCSAISREWELCLELFENIVTFSADQHGHPGVVSRWTPNILFPKLSILQYCGGKHRRLNPIFREGVFYVMEFHGQLSLQRRISFGVHATILVSSLGHLFQSFHSIDLISTKTRPIWTKISRHSSTDTWSFR